MFNKGKKKESIKNNDELIEEICSATWKDIYRFIYYKVQNKEEAEDITQETYAKALPYLQDEKISMDKCRSFLKTIALNIIRDNWRKSKRQGIMMNIDDVEPGKLGEDDFADAYAIREWTENALKTLNDEQRTIIELRILRGYSVEETAKYMNKSEGNIRVIQYRALQSLGTVLKKSI
ncbi:RNA polymerase sigma-70 factor (ECF subfamily) [Mobilisporobacter senegalensis]|uniref:RNA polymerase sigma factor n=1 Tax=Mobilisporobacter senegalensis TaxID=1329262 RepID=A0A3N1XNU3_9FIRM|nr:RNA polymerase sigma factor [Mobilisporobacter senegalensis]ROR28335.1 RNA polymerase sigma-70 factor (ECF subfamily) [Mobilisporobacter senegalensis]